MTFECGETFVGAAVTFAGTAAGTALDTEGCFRAVVVAVWWHLVDTIAAVGHSHHSRVHSIVYCGTFDVLLVY